MSPTQISTQSFSQRGSVQRGETLEEVGPKVDRLNNGRFESKTGAGADSPTLALENYFPIIQSNGVSTMIGRSRARVETEHG